MRMRAWPSLVLVLVRCSADLDVLWRWGTQNGADLERVRASDTLAHGRGLVWRCSEQVPPPSCLEFREGDALFHLPARLAMSSRDAAASEPLRRALARTNATMSEQAIRAPLALLASPNHVLEAFVAHERLRGDASFWRPYLDTLPSASEMGVAAALARLSACDDSDDLAAVIAAARAARRALARSRFALDSLRDAATELVEVAHILGALLSGEGAAWSRAAAARAALWALSAVESRAVSAPELGAVSLVPFFDLINHVDGTLYAANALALEGDGGEGGDARGGRIAFRVRPAGARAVTPEGELLANYKDTVPCPHAWLSVYGFVPDRYSAAAGACAAVELGGRRWVLPHDRDDLLARANASAAYARALAAALEARAQELPPDAELRAQRDADDRGGLDFGAAVIMLHERGALEAVRRRVAELHTCTDGEISRPG